MYVNCCLVSIENEPGKKALDFVKVNEIKIVESSKNMTATCTIKLPRKINILNGNINDVIKRGSKVTVKLGYDFNMMQEFTGYVARVNAEIPLTIECEDEMWLLKQGNTFTKSWSKVKVAEIIKYIYPGKTSVIDLTLGAFIIKDLNAVKVLELLKKVGLRSYFRNGVLVVDFATSIQAGRRVYYNFKRNIIDPKLKYNRQDDLRLRVKGISKFKNGKIVEEFFGDSGGELRTMHFVELDKSDLQKVIRNEFEKLKFDGYKGSFETFLVPYIKPGDTAVLTDPDYPERAGSYQVETVETTFSMRGARREVSPERKIA